MKVLLLPAPDASSKPMTHELAFSLRDSARTISILYPSAWHNASAEEDYTHSPNCDALVGVNTPASHLDAYLKHTAEKPETCVIVNPAKMEMDQLEKVMKKHRVKGSFLHKISKLSLKHVSSLLQKRS